VNFTAIDVRIEAIVELQGRDGINKRVQIHSSDSSGA
jgi:hypothetical protein